MPLKKKHKYRGKIIFWTLALLFAFLMVYVPKSPNADNAPTTEYELY